MPNIEIIITTKSIGDGFSKAIAGIESASVASEKFQKLTGLAMKTGTPGYVWNEEAKQFVDANTKKFASFGKVQQAMAKEAAAALQVQRNYEKLEQAESAAETKSRQHAQSRTVARDTVMALSGALSVMQSALGDNLSPATKKAFDGLSTVASAAMQGASVGGVYGAVIGGVAGAVLTLAASAMQASPEVQAFNAELGKYATSDQAAKGLANMAGVTELQARAALNAAANNAEYARTLKLLSESAQPGNLSSLQIVFDGLGKKTDEAATSAKQLFVIYQYGAAYANGLTMNLGDQAKAQQYASIVTKEAIKLMFGNADAQNQLKKAITETSPALQEQNRLVNLYKQAIPQAAAEQKQFNQQITELGTSHKKAQSGFSKDILKAQSDAASERVKLEANALGDIANAEHKLSDERTKINASLLEKLGDMEQDRNDKKSDDYYSYVKDLEGMERDRTKSAEENARARESIERETIQAIADLDAQTSTRLNDAKTEHEAARIRYEADLERAKLARDQQGKFSDLEQKKRADDEEFAYKRRLRDEDYAHAAAIDNREYAQSIARLQRETQQQLQEAQTRTADEITQIRLRTAEQVKASDERAQKEITSIRERAAEESANYADQKAKAQSAHADRIKEITDTRTEAQKLSADMANLADPAWQPWINKANEYKGVMSTLMGWNPTGGNIPWAFGTGNDSTRGYASGGDFIVPPGYPNDSYPLRVQSGERVTITPSSQVNQPRSIGNVTINVNGAQSPRATAEEIRRLFNDLVRQ